MNIFIFGANWFNRGDESAIRAMIDELRIIYPTCNMRININWYDISEFPYSDIPQVRSFNRPGGRNKLKLIPYYISLLSKGKFNFLKRTDNIALEEFVKTVRWADIVLYAPGGPMIGDYYEPKYLLDKLLLIKLIHTPYLFYAPSMGPFTKNRLLVKSVLKSASLICFREEISKRYFDELKLNKKAYITFDSALQNKIDMDTNQKILSQNTKLNNFLANHKQVVGITITDLKWHREYKNTNISQVIKEVFEKFIERITDDGTAILFIPQLFGKDCDRTYMNEFAVNNCYVLSDTYDCYFQQFLISKLFAVVGMRYHSNIFSAKMSIPFISISYEQKMEGFMRKAGLMEYCINVKDLNENILVEKFNILIKKYNTYKTDLEQKIKAFQSESHKTTELVMEFIQKNNIR